AYVHPEYFKRNPKTCAPVFISATHENSAIGQMTLYQDTDGNTWVQGAYQSGFHDEKDWSYVWTIKNACGDVIYNISDTIEIKYFKGTACDAAPGGPVWRKRNGKSGDDCREHIGEWGVKNWITKITDLTWSCDGKGIKHQTCSGKDIYKDMVPKYLLYGHDAKHDKRNPGNPAPININDEVLPRRLSDIVKKRQGGTSTFPAPINVNNDGNVINPPANNPPAANPNPPANNPPANNPPANNPPANNPPANNPPANNPPANPTDAPAATDTTAPGTTLTTTITTTVTSTVPLPPPATST
ncbi:25705_t:CDS:2, partial [Racocetra persica]